MLGQNSSILQSRGGDKGADFFLDAFGEPYRLGAEYEKGKLSSEQIKACHQNFLPMTIGLSNNKLYKPTPFLNLFNGQLTSGSFPYGIRQNWTLT